MQKTIYVCDKCGKRKESSSPSIPDGWRTIKIELSQYNYESFDLCDKCLESLGIYKDNDSKHENQVVDIKDQLFNIFEEIASNAMEQK